MGKCSKVTSEFVSEATKSGAIAKDGKVLNEELLKIYGNSFEKDFTKVYGVHMPYGSVQDGVFKLNQKAEKHEDSIMAEAKETFPDVDIRNNIVKLSDNEFIFADKILLVSGILENITDDFVVNVRNKDNKLVRKTTYGELMKYSNPLSEVVTRLKVGDSNLLPGVSIQGSRMLNTLEANGKKFAKKVEGEVEKSKSIESLLQKKLADATTISKETKRINSLLDKVLAKTNTEYSVVIEDSKNRSVFGTTDTGVITVSPNNIGMNDYITNKDDKLAYVYLHEKAHVVTMGLLNTNKAYSDKMEKLYQAFKDAGMDVNAHNVPNLAEFLAEAMSNTNFQRTLQNVAYTDLKTSMWDKLVELVKNTLSKITGIDIKDDLLSEVLASTYLAGKQSDSSPLNGPVSNALRLLEDLDMEGNIINEPSAQVMDIAKKLGFTYKTGQGFFHTNENGEIVKVNRGQMASLVNSNFAKYTNTMLFSKDDLVESELNDVEEQFVVFNKNNANPFDLESINSIQDLIDVQAAITSPNKTESGKYEVKSAAFYRTTASLGFSATRDQGLENASAIGNFADELGKRIFSEEAPGNRTYPQINDFIKNEARDLANKEGKVNMAEWERQYKNPVSEEAFNDLTDSLLETKDKLAKEYNVKKFHTDIVVWDNDSYVAGETDVLAEHEDGTLTVIDLKTRRQGLDNYNVSEAYSKSFNTKTKHTMQTNTYSNALAKMGFELNAPIIVMAQPDYPLDVAVEDAPFMPIKGDSFIAIIPLDRREGEVADYNVNPKGSVNHKLKSAHTASMAEYRAFVNKKKRSERVETGEEVNITDAQRERLKDKLKLISNRLISFQNINKKKGASVAFTEELTELIDEIERTHSAEIDESLLLQQLVVAESFFTYAAEQLEELRLILKDSHDDLDTRKSAYIQTRDYRGVFKAAQELFEDLETLKDALDLPETIQYTSVVDKFREFEQTNALLNTDLEISLKTIFKEMVTDSYLGSKGEIKFNNQLRKEAEEKFPGDEEAVLAYIAEEKRKPERIEAIKQAAKEEVEQLIHNPSNDITSMSYQFSSDVEINNQYVQIFNKMLMNAEQEFSTVANEEIIELSKLHQETNLSQQEIEELIVRDHRGNAYLRGDYNIEFFNEKNKFKAEQRKIKSALEEVEVPKERAKLSKELNESNLAYTRWYKKNTEGDQVKKPIGKWKTDFSNLSENQIKVLEALKDISIKSEERTGGRKSLIRTAYIDGVYFHKLPGVLRSTYGHVAHGNLLGAVKKEWDESTKIEKDDTEEGGTTNVGIEKTRRAFTGLDGKPAYEVPIFFRGNLGEKQSTDLFTIYAMELQNSIRYNIDTKLSGDATIYLDMVKSSKFFNTVGINSIKTISKFAPADTKEIDTLDGDASNVAKQIDKMMKARVFSITQEYAGEILGKDVNRLTGAILGYTAFASMSFRVLGASNNWVTGNVATAIEMAGGEFFSTGNLAKAKGVYYKNIGGILGDMGAPVKTNFVNQLMAVFDIKGERDILNNEFERKNAITRHLKSSTTLGGHSMGEHEIHATVLLSVLDGQKITNKEGKFLDKNGKVVESRKQAASVLDAYVKEEDGVVRLASWAEYSEFDAVNSLQEGGLTSLRALAKDRVTRTQGAFDKRMQGEIDRQWYGKLFKQFKRHLVPQYLNRFRGLQNVNKSTDVLKDDKKFFNYSAKTEEYGYYTSFLRFIHGSAKTLKWDILSYMNSSKNGWKDLTVHERSNIKKTMAELQYVLATFILAAMAGAALDDDDEALWGLTYLLRRQAGEGGLQYLDPRENWRIIDSPMAAFGKVSSIMDAVTQLTEPFEEYETGTREGDSKLRVKAGRAFIYGNVLDQAVEGYTKQMHSNLLK